MYERKTIGAVIPAYNEESQIGRVVETMPAFVDKMIVVDDGSSDNTAAVVESIQKQEDRLELTRHETNRGVGAAIATGYKWARDHELDVAVVMAGDGQMDPDDLAAIVDPVARGEADYAKANRLFTGESWKLIPKHRYLGNSFLSLLTKIASGYWHVADSQTGYTAISRRALALLPLGSIYPRYGYPNDLLVKLNVFNCRVRDVPARPVYRVGESSGIKLWQVVPKMSWLLLRRFLWRLKEKYIIRDFHPLVFFYLAGLIVAPLGAGFGLWAIVYRLFVGKVAATTALFAAFLFLSGMQFLLFAMWLDMESNKHLR